MPWSHLGLLAQEDTVKKWRHSCATQLAAEQWAAQTAKDHSTGGGNSVRGSKRTLPIWLLTLPASSSSHCPPRRPADGSEARPGAGKESNWWSDNISISEFMFIHVWRIKSSDETHLRCWLLLSSGLLCWTLAFRVWSSDDAREGDRCNNIFYI